MINIKHTDRKRDLQPNSFLPFDRTVIIMLIVDDSPVQADQLKMILDDNYKITIAQTAEDGLRCASCGDYSLILLDVIMPGIDGFMLLI